jgi:asparagine synthase (glutamine-hydrolysing)
MCGIIAGFDGTGGSSLAAVQRGLNVLRHRGPDSARTWESAGGHVSLGHARLSIIDLVTGDQPLANEDETIHVVVNGEFYGFEQIRTELEALGHRFRTHSDSEIVLHLYEEFGVAFVHRLRGEYAFVLWDERKQVLLAVRDRFGIKPLFYSQKNDRLLFASEVKALHAAGVEPAWDEEGFLQTITLTAPLGGRTLFRNVAQVPPGHYLLAGIDGFSTHSYWDFNYASEEEMLPAQSDDEYKEQFRAILEDAVRTRLRADVSVGCYLSGGIDSCSILGLMARHASNTIRAFSLSFDDVTYDESVIAREMAERAGAEITVIPITHASLAADFSDAIWHGETLFFNAHCVAKFALSRAVRNAGFKVVLTGEGSDEILAGYPHFRLDAARHCGGAEGEALRQALGNGNGVSRGLLLPDGDVTPPVAFVQRLGYCPAWIETRESVLQRFGQVLPASFHSHDLYSRVLDRLDIPGQLTGRHVVNQSLYLWNKTTLPGYILTVLGDRMEMAHSVEGRLPFLDHHVVEFTRTLPASQKIRGTVEKFVLREAMRPLLTPTVYARQKHPFLAPPAILKPDEPLHDLMQDTLRGRALQAMPFFNRDAVIRTLDGASSLDDAGKIALEVPLMTLLSASILGERFHL